MQDHTGWRANIGVVCAAANVVVEPECYAMAPPGIAFCATRLSLQDEGAPGRGLDRDELARCTRYLVDAALRVVVLGVSVAESGAPAALAAAVMRDAGAALPITAADAVVAALRALGTGRITVVAAGSAADGEREAEFLTASGMRIVDTVNLALPAAAPAGIVYRGVRAAAGRASEAIYIAGCDVETAAALAPLEQDLGRPVVSTVQACLWAALRAAGIADPIAGFGALLAR